MGTHEEFAKFLLKHNAQNSAPRLALYNYLKNLTDPKAAFNINTINNFYRKCLTFEHWRKEAVELGRETDYFLKKFADLHSIEIPNHRLPSKIQVVQLSHIEDRKDAVQNFLNEKHLKNQTTIYHENECSILVTILDPNRLQVTVLDNWYFISDGLLRPLCWDQVIHYDSQLEPEFGITHQISLLPQTLTQFNPHANGIDVHYIQGMTFKKIRSYRITKLQEDKHLYFKLKKLERYFIDRKTDPMYLEVISKLEQALYILEQKGESAQAFAEQAFEVGQNFYLEAFPDDKMLYHLLEDLRILMMKKGLWKTSFDSISL